ncbi:MAG: hypothetical protein IIC23_13910, partial [Chloroflexi bacterium]|nr:hypothetical protein [Chloroflexota bacterium]
MQTLDRQGLWHMYEDIELPLVPSVMEMASVGMGCLPEVLDDIEREILPQLEVAKEDIVQACNPQHLVRLAELSA